jgi:hypothetical protein
MSSKAERKSLKKHTLTLEANAKAEAEREQAEAQASDSANATERQAEAPVSDSAESACASVGERGSASGSRKKQKDSSTRSQRHPVRVRQALVEEKRESERRAMSLQLEDSKEQVVALKAQLTWQGPQFPMLPPKPSTVVVNEDPFLGDSQGQ